MFDRPARRPLLVACTVILSACALSACTGAESEAPSETEGELLERARGIHERVITLDTHVDISPANFTAERNYAMDLPTQVTLPKMEEGGLDVAWFIVYVGQGELTDEGYANATAQAIEKFEAIHRLTREIAPDRIELAVTSDGVRRIVASGRKVAMIGIENAYQVGLDLGNIERFHDLGGRYMSLAHNGHSQFSDSNTGERDGVWLHDGLSDLGRRAVAEMNRVGIVIDISHPSKDAIMEMLALTRAPVIASHSSARALNDVSRNLDDEQLMAVKENGGVVQAVAFRSYLDSEKNRRHQEAAQAVREEIAEELGITLMERRELFTMSTEERSAYFDRVAPVEAALAERRDEIDAEAPPVDVADFVDHVDYLVETIGIEHVGISSDFDGGGGVDGWADASETFNVTLELVRRGYTEEEVAMLWGGNLLRVLDEVQRVAKEIQAGE